MTKAELTDDIAQALEISKREAKIILEVILDGTVRALKKGERVEIRRFGTFSTHVRAARQGRNPITGVQLDVGAKTVPRFRASRELRELLNGKGGAGTAADVGES